MWGAVSDERTGLRSTIAAGPRQRSHSWVSVPWDSWPYFTVSDSRLPEPGGPGPRIYILQKQGGRVISPGTGFPFCRLLLLAGLRWSYSKSKSHSDWRPVSQSWCRAPSGAHDQIFITVWQSRYCLCGAPSQTRGRVCLLSVSLLAVISHLS
jgi:hypothetical protein